VRLGGGYNWLRIVPIGDISGAESSSPATTPLVNSFFFEVFFFGMKCPKGKTDMASPLCVYCMRFMQRTHRIFSLHAHATVILALLE
jgi:hypothetical protein